MVQKTPSNMDKNQNSIDEALLDLARVTIELESPLHIGSGKGDDLIDLFCVTDANGLPAIPGSSLAGVLRTMWTIWQTHTTPPISADELFGHQGEGDDAEQSSQASRFVVSWGHLHASNNLPVSFRIEGSVLEEDELLRQARSPMIRQHVRINHRGVAAQTGLFDEEIVAAGHRFTFELMTKGCAPKVMDDLLSLMAAKSFRIGGKTRRGLGRFRLERCLHRRFDLRNPQDFDDYRRWPVDIATPIPANLRGLQDETEKSRQRHLQTLDVLSIQIRLHARGFWMIGGGEPRDEDAPQKKHPSKKSDDTKVPDIVPFREPRVFWQAEKGTLSLEKPVTVIPATSLKGALRHRARFHALVLEKIFADDLSNVNQDFLDQNKDFFDKIGQNQYPLPTLEELFGIVRKKSNKEKEDDSDKTDLLQAGRLVLEDVVIRDPPPTKVMDHLSIDRFTSGPLDGHLFQDLAYWGKMKAPIQLTIHVLRASELSPSAKNLLSLVLQDLHDGHIQLGGGYGRGHGWFEGDRPDPAFAEHLRLLASPASPSEGSL